MCGRYTSSKPADVYAELFKAKTGNLFVEPRYNIAPTCDSSR
jgi:putative SOS response-associated peptidase YedK